MNYESTFEYFIDNIWPDVVDRLHLPPGTEPSDEDFRTWITMELDAAG